jgi:hypothetical protein
VPVPRIRNCPIREGEAVVNADDVVSRFWRGIDTHDWELVAATLADDFVRIGMRDNAEDTSRGKTSYMEFVSRVVGKMEHHDLRTDRVFYSADGRTAVAETVETIRPPGEEVVVMRFANVMELDDDGLISSLDIFWKTPPRMPPSWITVDKVLDEADGSVTEPRI